MAKMAKEAFMAMIGKGKGGKAKGKAKGGMHKMPGGAMMSDAEMDKMMVGKKKAKATKKYK
jgi:hypothetical protein